MKILFISVLLSLILFSCNQNEIYSEHYDVDTAGFKWSIKDVKTYKVPVEHAGKYNVSIELRHGVAIKYGNVLLTLTQESPEGKQSEEQVNFMFRNKDGELLGSGMGDMYDTRQAVLKNVDLDKGTYTFKVKHRMKDKNPVSNILEVGLVVEKVN